VASAERITQDITALCKTTAKLAEELHQAYTDYLQALGQALRQKLILSGYHVCTQGYPTQFLVLSLNQRQALQQELRQIAQQSQAALVGLLRVPGPQEVEAVPDEGGGVDEWMGGWVDGMERAEEGRGGELAPRLLTPMELTQWQEKLEAAIAREFQVASFKANRLLHQTGILPNQLPDFLKATGKLDAEQAEAISQNMMDLLMEAQGNSEPDAEEDGNSRQTPIVVQLVAVHLQLAEVEFADAASSMLRNRLRPLIAHLKTLRQTFRKKERELAIAQAEAAWRSSWFED